VNTRRIKIITIQKQQRGIRQKHNITEIRRSNPQWGRIL